MPPALSERKNMTENFIIFDTEYASWQGFLDAPEEEKKKAEIVQIAALKVRLNDLSVIEQLNLYIKPHFTPKLTDYFINLTGITDQLLAKEGIPFPEAYRRFKEFVGSLPCYSHGWSLASRPIADGEVMNYNLDMFKQPDATPPDYRNIAEWFQQTYREKNLSITKQASGQIAKLLGIEEELQQLGLDEHNAFYDVHSILAGLRYLGFSKLY